MAVPTNRRIPPATRGPFHRTLQHDFLASRLHPAGPPAALAALAARFGRLDQNGHSINPRFSPTPRPSLGCAPRRTFSIVRLCFDTACTRNLFCRYVSQGILLRLRGFVHHGTGSGGRGSTHRVQLGARTCGDSVEQAARRGGWDSVWLGCLGFPLPAATRCSTILTRSMVQRTPNGAVASGATAKLIWACLMARLGVAATSPARLHGATTMQRPGGTRAGGRGNQQSVRPPLGNRRRGMLEKEAPEPESGLEHPAGKPISEVPGRAGPRIFQRLLAPSLPLLAPGHLPPCYRNRPGKPQPLTLPQQATNPGRNIILPRGFSIGRTQICKPS